MKYFLVAYANPVVFPVNQPPVSPENQSWVQEYVYSSPVNLALIIIIISLTLILFIIYLKKRG